MSYLSYYRPLLKELGQRHQFMARVMSTWFPSEYYRGSLHDMWGRESFRGFGDTDVHEVKTHITVSSDMPGACKDSMRVYFHDDILTLYAERNEDKYMEEDIYGNMQRGFGWVTKSIRLPHNTDYNRISATYKDGVLSVVIPKPEGNKNAGREIEIPIQ